MGEERKCSGFWWESPKERDQSENRDVDGRMWNGFKWLMIGIGGVLL
jgi:hypothetical protein